MKKVVIIGGAIGLVIAGIGVATYIGYKKEAGKSEDADKTIMKALSKKIDDLLIERELLDEAKGSDLHYLISAQLNDDGKLYYSVEHITEDEVSVHMMAFLMNKAVGDGRLKHYWCRGEYENINDPVRQIIYDTEEHGWTMNIYI